MIQVTMGQGGLPKIVLTATDGARAEIHLHGAHLTSWRTSDGSEQLYLSKESEFRADKAIRGGVPIILPQFDTLGPLPRHGFARTSEWQVVADEHDDSGAATITLTLTDAPVTRAIWDRAFRFNYTVTIQGSKLRMRLQVMNTGSEPFTFTGALHTYLAVSDIGNVQIVGLDGVTFHDKTRLGMTDIQKSGGLEIASETDRVYISAPNQLRVRDGARTINVMKSGFPDVVIWNPYDKAATLPDITPGGERHFVCVEAAVAANPIQLAGGADWNGAQGIEIRRN